MPPAHACQFYSIIEILASTHDAGLYLRTIDDGQKDKKAGSVTHGTGLPGQELPCRALLARLLPSTTHRILRPSTHLPTGPSPTSAT